MRGDHPVVAAASWMVSASTRPNLSKRVSRLRAPADGPGAGVEFERRRRQQLPARRAQPLVPRRVEARDVGPGRPDPVRVGLPPRLEALEAHGGGQLRLAQLTEPRGIEELGEVALPRAGEVGLVT